MKRVSPGVVYWSRVRSRRAVESQSLLGRKRLKGWTYGLALFLGFALFHVWVRVQVVETGYQIRSLSARLEELKGEQHTLRLESATLKSPARLEEVSRQLGLKRPPQHEVTLMTARNP